LCNFSTIEIGGFALFNLSNLNIGIGGKIDFILYAEYEKISSKSKWDRSNWFYKQTGDLGLRVSYSYKPFLISLESWFGIMNMISGPTDGADIYQNHFGVLIGYTF